MTVQSETSRNDYIGAGTTDTYSYTFRIFAAADLLVTQADTDGLETQLNYPADFSVTGVGSFNGGTIVLSAGNLPSGYALTIRFKSTLTQGVSIRNQGAYYPNVVEDALDRLTKLDQQQQDEIDRTIKLPETETGSVTLPTQPQRASRFLAFDAGGLPIASAGGPGAAPVSSYMETVVDDTSAGAVIETLRTTLADEATPADNDEVIIRDTSATTGKRMTIANFLKSILNNARTFAANYIFSGTMTLNGAVTCSSTFTAGGATGGAFPVGALVYVAQSRAPAGFLKCDGSAVSRSTYAALFNTLVFSSNVTITIASPGVVAWTAHGLSVNDPVKFTTTGALPTGLIPGTTYYVISAGLTANSFQVSATPGGSAVNTSGSQSGTHTAINAPHGDGDGSTTFNVPELRGEFIRGLDNGRAVDTNRSMGSAQADAFKSHTHDYATPFNGGSAFLVGGASPTNATVATSATGGTETRPRNIAMLACIKY